MGKALPTEQVPPPLNTGRNAMDKITKSVLVEHIKDGLKNGLPVSTLNYMLGLTRMTSYRLRKSAGLVTGRSSADRAKQRNEARRLYYNLGYSCRKVCRTIHVRRATVIR